MHIQTDRQTHNIVISEIQDFAVFLALGPKPGLRPKIPEHPLKKITCNFRENSLRLVG